MNDKNKIVVPEEEYWGVVHDQFGFGKIYIQNSMALISESRKLQLPKDKIVEKCKNIASGDDKQGWLICGGVGTGKTTIMCYMSYVILRHKRVEVMPDGDSYRISSYPSYYHVRTGELFNLFFEKKLDRIDELRECSILFLDDLGVEYSTEYPLSKFEDFIEYRYSELKTTFITTNLTPERLREDLDWARIVDRLFDKKWMQLVTIAGGSLRGKETQ